MMLRTGKQLLLLLKAWDTELKLPKKGKDLIIVLPLLKRLEFGSEIIRCAWTDRKSDATGERLYNVTFEDAPATEPKP